MTKRFGKWREVREVDKTGGNTMPESYETPGSSLGKITRWWQGEKAAGKTPQPWEAQNAYLDEMGLLKGGTTMPFSDVLNKKNAQGLGRTLASKGNRGDTMLAHINPEEARLLKMMGGSGTINPKTGLPQFGPEEDYYFDLYPDVKAAMEAEGKGYNPSFAQAHYQNYGQTEGRTWGVPANYTAPAPTSNSGVNAASGTTTPSYTPATGSAYLAANPDVKAAGSDPWEHYQNYGKKEGRKWDMEVSPSYFHDPEGGYQQYVEDFEKKYPQYDDWDYTRTGPTPEMQSYGQWAASDASSFQRDPEAGYQRYSQGHQPQDVAKAYRESDDAGLTSTPPLSYDEWHDLYKAEEPKEPAKYTSGPGAHLQKTDVEFSPPAGWDPKLYLEKNPDLLDDPWAAANPLAHYKLFGEEQGRGRVAGGYDKANVNQASRLYLDRNPDVGDAYLTGGLSPWEHYELHGKDEGRKWQGEEPKIDFSKAQLPYGGDSYRIGNAIRAIRDGYYIVPPNGDSPFGSREEPGTKVPVDRYGWKEVTGDQRLSTIPVGSHYNVLTQKWLKPGDKPSMSKKGEDMPSRPGTPNLQNFFKTVIPGAVNIMTSPASSFGYLTPVASSSGVFTAGRTNKPPLWGLLE